MVVALSHFFLPSVFLLSALLSALLNTGAFLLPGLPRGALAAESGGTSPEVSQDIELAPIIKEGSAREGWMAGDAWVEDGMVPARQGETQLNAGTGSIQNTLQNQVALPVTEYGRAGGAAQVRGFGFSAEDVDVQVLGLSLNPPQGGGFDLSIFPQYLWSGYRLSLGPALNALNPSASTGTLSLVPWTARALGHSGFGGRAVVMTTSLGVTQTSVAASEAREGKSAAAVAGFSSGSVVGPSASVSARWEGETIAATAHVLMTDLDSVTLGSVDFPTPFARTRSRRVIPMVQWDARVTKASLLKTSFFSDWGSLSYRDPGGGSESQQDFQQWGFESAYLVGPWRLGLRGRQSSYRSHSVDPAAGGREASGVELPLQSFGTLQVSREVQVGRLSLDPTVQGEWVTGYGWMPEGSLGGRREWNQGQESVFGRLSYSKRIPSLLDRYGLGLSFVGNPALQAETDWTGTLGVETVRSQGKISLQGYTQWKQDARVPTGMTVSNLRDAWIVAVTGGGTWFLSRHFDLNGSGTWSRSRLILTGNEFPYVPRFLGLLGFNWHDHREKRRWEWLATARFSSSQGVSTVAGDRLPGYVTLDSSVQVGLTQALHLAGRVEDIFDRPIEMVRGYPMGRTFSVLIAGEI